MRKLVNHVPPWEEEERQNQLWLQCNAYNWLWLPLVNRYIAEELCLCITIRDYRDASWFFFTAQRLYMHMYIYIQYLDSGKTLQLWTLAVGDFGK